MNKNGQVGLNFVLIALIGILVGIVLLPTIAEFVSKSTGTVSLVNGTYTAPAEGSSIDLPGQELLSTPIVNNVSGPSVPTTNYTIAEGISNTTSLKRILLTMPVGSGYDAQEINISYDFGPEGYIDNAGGRSLASLVIIFVALAIAVIALVPTLKSKILDFRQK